MKNKKISIKIKKKKTGNKSEVIVAAQNHSGAGEIKDRRQEKGGSKNEQAELLKEIEDEHEFDI